MKPFSRVLFLAILPVCVSVSSYAFTGKKSNKDSVHIHNLKVQEIKEGRHLKYARQLSLSDFMVYYITYGKKYDSKLYGRQHFIELYKDQDYTYLGRQVDTTYLVDFVKVTTNELKDVDLNAYDGEQIRKRFFAEVVPEEDKKRLAEKEKQCSGGFDNPSFTYAFTQQKQLEVIFDWKISCEFLYKIMNKRYIASYDPVSGQFGPLTVESLGKK